MWDTLTWYVYIRTSVSGFNETTKNNKTIILEVYRLANIKSAKKRILVNQTKDEINKAATKGVYHKNTSSRKISRLNKAVNKMA